jgi:hypothetical protein
MTSFKDHTIRATLTNNINELGEIKKKKTVKIDSLSRLAPEEGLEPPA